MSWLFQECEAAVAAAAHRGTRSWLWRRSCWIQGLAVSGSAWSEFWANSQVEPSDKVLLWRNNVLHHIWEWRFLETSWCLHYSHTRFPCTLRCCCTFRSPDCAAGTCARVFHVWKGPHSVGPIAFCQHFHFAETLKIKSVLQEHQTVFIWSLWYLHGHMTECVSTIAGLDLSLLKDCLSWTHLPLVQFIMPVISPPLTVGPGNWA